jgi:hypothetical protein
VGRLAVPVNGDLQASRSPVSRNPSHNAALTTEATAAAQLVSKSSTRDLLRLYGAIHLSSLAASHTVT